MRVRAKAARLCGRLSSMSLRLATAESLTGGLIGAAITSIPGSSSVYSGGVVSYSEALKERLLGVDPALIASRGVVSVEVAEAMARGALNATGSDVSVAVTGVAGPGGGSAGTPVGTVCIATARKNSDGGIDVVGERVRFAGSRKRVRERTVSRAIDMALSHLDR
jgi:PncC family amidohydrolase